MDIFFFGLVLSFGFFSSVILLPLVLPFLDDLWSAVRGGLGGAVVRFSFRDVDRVLPFPSARSVGSGVRMSIFRPASSLPQTDSLLWALEKVG